jgi:hypothetical protein
MRLTHIIHLCTTYGSASRGTDETRTGVGMLVLLNTTQEYQS